jgi:hypothetical protein
VLQRRMRRQQYGDVDRASSRRSRTRRRPGGSALSALFKNITFTIIMRIELFNKKK